MPRHLRVGLLAIVLLALPGCAFSLHPHFLSGADAAEMIDGQVGDPLDFAQPGLGVGYAKCPFLLNLTGQHSRATCALPVGRLTVRVDIVNEYGDNVRAVDALVVERTAEHDLSTQLARQYGVPFEVRCEGDPIRIVGARETQACTATGPDGLRKVLEAYPRDTTGSLSAGSLAGIESAEVRYFGREAAEQRTGGVTLRGRDVERYLTMRLSGDDDLRRRHLVPVPRCPPTLALYGTRHVSCLVTIGHKSVREGVRFDEGRGVVFTDGPPVFAVAAVALRAKRSLERAMRRDGAPQTVEVNCGRELTVILEPGTSLPCRIATPRATHAIAVTFVSYPDEFRFDLVDD